MQWELLHNQLHLPKGAWIRLVVLSVLNLCSIAEPTGASYVQRL